MARIVCVAFFLMACQEVCGQRTLVLIKKNNVVARFKEGDAIRFQRKDRDYFTSGIITGISTEFFKLGDEDTTYLFQVKSIDLRSHPNSSFKTAEAGSKLILAGAILILIDALNISNASKGNKISTGIIVASSVLIGSGTFMLFVNNNYFKTSHKKKVIVMD